MHYPELNLVRTAVLDYFDSPEQKRLAKIFSWEDSFTLPPGQNLIKYLRNINRDIAYAAPAVHASLFDALPESSLLMKNYPELRQYRDIVFFWKCLLNPDRKAFPNYIAPESETTTPGPFGEAAPVLQRQHSLGSSLLWTWSQEEKGYLIQAFGGMQLRCRPNPEQTDPVTGKKLLPEELPLHRYPSTATASFYVPPPPIYTEDDCIYRPTLPNFEEEQGQVLSQVCHENLNSSSGQKPKYNEMALPATRPMQSGLLAVKVCL